MKVAFGTQEPMDYDAHTLKKELLSMEYECDELKDALDYLKQNRKCRYFIYNWFSDNPEFIQIDYGSHSEFCYFYNLNLKNVVDFLV